MGYGLVKQTLPCAGKNCKSKMTLTDKTDNMLYYNCIKEHDEHTFRYNIKQKKWEKIILKTKIILHYNEDPCDEPQTPITNHVVEVTKDAGNDQPKNVNTKTTKKAQAKKAKNQEPAGIKTQSEPPKTAEEQLPQKTESLAEQVTSEEDKPTNEQVEIPAEA